MEKTRSRIPFLATALVATGLVSVSPVALSQSITVRVMPPEKAQFLQNQRFDIRVEASATGTDAKVSELRVAVDGIDVTARGVAAVNAAGTERSWMFKWAEFGIVGNRVISATAAGTAGSTPLSASGQSRITIREWDRSQIRNGHESFPEVVAASRANARLAEAEAAAALPDPNELHLGANDPAFFQAAAPSAPAQRPAKNVILFIGDGMGVAHRTAARVLSKGYTGGKANGTLAMDRMPWNGLLMTSSLNSLITDSAPGAHNYSTGNKTNNGMEGVFPDNTPDESDNPRIDNLSQFLTRHLGKVTGVVSDAFLTDATPAAFLAHTANRGNGTLVAGQYFDERNDTNLKVLLGGGSYHFIPRSQTGSRRTDERNVIEEFKADGYAFVETATALSGYTASGTTPRLLGLFNLDNMNVAFDKLKKGDPTVVSAFPDQPFLKLMTQKSIEVLSRYPNGFFLMVEGAHIDKQAHAMDAERSIYDVIQLDQAIQVALDFAIATNSDADPDNDTLVIVSADHECAGLTLPGVGRPDKKGTRDYVKAYNYSDGVTINDTKTSNFTNYVDADGDGYPDNPDADRKLIINFGANSDRWEDWQSNPRPKAPSAAVSGVSVANPNDPDKNAAGALMIPGVIENGSNGGSAETAAVHTMSDIPISAYGPGASQFARITDNTEAFFSIVNAILGQYPVPTQF